MSQGTFLHFHKNSHKLKVNLIFWQIVSEIVIILFYLRYFLNNNLFKKNLQPLQALSWKH